VKGVTITCRPLVEICIQPQPRLSCLPSSHGNEVFICVNKERVSARPRVDTEGGKKFKKKTLSSPVVVPRHVQGFRSESSKNIAIRILDKNEYTPFISRLRVHGVDADAMDIGAVQECPVVKGE